MLRFFLWHVLVSHQIRPYCPVMYFAPGHPIPNYGPDFNSPATSQLFTSNVLSILRSTLLFFYGLPFSPDYQVGFVFFCAVLLHLYSSTFKARSSRERVYQRPYIPITQFPISSQLVTLDGSHLDYLARAQANIHIIITEAQIL